MKKDRWFLLVSLLSVQFYFGQKEQLIDTVNVRKKNDFQGQIKAELNRKDLEKSTGENLANVLKNISGVTLLQNGVNISKPVIQGLTNQRILTLNNGVRIESQQWGNDHAPEIDPFLAQNVEVVKGAEAVKYGSNAIGGVVILKSENLPYFGRKLSGKTQLIGESNTEKWAGNVVLQGNISKENAFAWRVQSSGKKAGNYRTADYFVDNTGAKELNYSANVGYKMEKEKIEAFYSYFSTELGIFRGSRIGSISDWELRLQEGRPITDGHFSYKIDLPKQKVNHHLGKVSLESHRNFGKTNLVYAFQKNHREEYDIRRGAFSDKPTFDVELSTHSLSLDFEKNYAEYFKTLVGGSWYHQENRNIEGTGVNSILPNFISRNVGAYFSQEFQKNAWTINAGIRYDNKNFNAAGYNRYGTYYSGKRKFEHWSYNFGIHKTFGENFSLSSNVGMAWRSPEAIELFSNGVHHGSAFYVQGDENLQLEKGLKWSSKLQFSNEHFLISTDFFVQKIKGFIYEMPTKTFINTWGGEFPVFQYKQSDALFKGADLDLRYKISSWLDYQGKFSVVYASNLTEDYYFPSISPENLRQKLNFKSDAKGWSLELEHFWANQQKRFSTEADLMPNSPKAYHLFGASLHKNLSIFSNNDMNLSFSVQNIFNHLYKDYTDRFRYFAHGMGRNFQFRVNYYF